MPVPDLWGEGGEACGHAGPWNTRNHSGVWKERGLSAAGASGFPDSGEAVWREAGQEPLHSGTVPAACAVLPEPEHRYCQLHCDDDRG